MSCCDSAHKKALYYNVMSKVAIIPIYDDSK